MPRVVSHGKIIYSVDLMFAYINIFKPPIIKIPLADIKVNFDANYWGEPGKTNISINDVLANKKKYAADYGRIKSADLSYPIIMHNGIVYDGIHRYIKAMMLKKKTINAYVFDNKLMKKFIINKTGNYDVKMETNEYIELFYKSFCE